MSRPKIIFTPAYEESLHGIEDFIYRSSQDLVALEAFADEHDRVLRLFQKIQRYPPYIQRLAISPGHSAKDATAYSSDTCRAARKS